MVHDNPADNYYRHYCLFWGKKPDKFNFIMKNKKALTSTTLILMIIAIAGFVVVGYAATQILNIFPTTVDKYACRASVDARAGHFLGLLAGKGGHITPEIYPLACKTQQLSISSSKDDEINSKLANALSDCWWMLGEGQKDFIAPNNWLKLERAGDIVGLERSTCIVCSEIKFNDAAKNKNIDLMNYLKNTPTGQNVTPEGQSMTYFQYLYGTNTELPTSVTVAPLDTNNDYAIVFTGIRGAYVKDQLVKAGVMGTAGGIAFGAASGAAIGAFGGPIGAAGGAIIGAIAGVIGGGTAGTASLAANAYASSLYCDGKTGGCYSLMLIKESPAELAKACQKIESIP
jgi:hypothetical protein